MPKDSLRNKTDANLGKRGIIRKSKSSKNSAQIQSHNHLKGKQGPCIYDVFLGGACNPTTWRQDEAIPFLNSEGIQYYNPQVDIWSEDLMQKEALAKKNSRILLFVFDPSQTRGLSSLVELAYLVAKGKRVVVVRPAFEDIGPISVNGERLSMAEQNSLLMSFETLDKLLQDTSSVFTCLEDALKLIRNDLKEPTTNSHRENISRKTKMSGGSAARQKPGYPFQKDACPSCGKVGIRLSTLCENFEVHNPKVFCCNSHNPVLFDSKRRRPFDAFLGGTLGADELSPFANLSYILTKRGACIDFAQLDVVQKLCSKIFYKFNLNSFNLPAQIEAAYTIGKGRSVVLCAETFPANEIIPRKRPVAEAYALFEAKRQIGTLSASEQLLACSEETRNMSTCAIKDHNRSRSYLTSIAREMDCKVVDPQEFIAQSV